MEREMDETLTKREWMAVHAPAPTEEQIEMEIKYDNRRSPNIERRSSAQIEVDLRFKWADAMLSGPTFPQEIRIRAFSQRGI